MWAQLGLNQRPPDYESGATNQLSYGPFSLLRVCQRLSNFDFNLYSAGKFELHEGIYGLGGGTVDV